MTTKPGRNKTVTVKCAYCGNEFQAIESRVKKGQGRFCSRVCAGQDQVLGKDRKYVGKQNAKRTFNIASTRWTVYWFDEVTSKRYNSTYAKWWWEMNRGVVPMGYRASYKDGNPQNISDDNIVLISPEEFGSKMSKLLFGKEFSPETREKMSIAKKGSHLSQSHKDHIGEATKKMWQEGVFGVRNK